AVATRHDALLGVRSTRGGSSARRIISSTIPRVLPRLFGVSIRDANAPFKIVRRAVWQQARAAIPTDSLIPSLMLAIFLKRGRFDVVEHDVEFRSRAAGVSSLGGWRLARFCSHATIQLLSFRRALKS